MNRFNRLLIAALAVQVLIAGGVYFGNQSPTAEQMQMALLNTESSQIDRITIDEADDKQTVLAKVDGKWQLPNYHQLPANQNKVDEILRKLETTKSGWPVATTESSRERFEVADENFQKRIVLSSSGEAKDTIYLGTSPGFRQLHLRRDGEDEVYAVKLNSYDFSSQQNDWLDITLLQPKADIVSLKGPDFSFSKQGGDWQLDEGDGEVVKEEIEKLTNTLARLTVQSADKKTIDNSTYELIVKSAGDTDTFHYRFFKDSDNHYIFANDYDLAFKVNKSDYEKIAGRTAMQLVRQTVVEKQGSIAGSDNANSLQNPPKFNKQQEEAHNENS